MHTEIAAMAGSIFFPAVMIYAGLMDVATLKIRNSLVLLLIAAFAILAPLAGLGSAEIGWSLVAAGAVLLCGFVLFALGWIGGGDAKLATAAVLWVGAEHALTYFTYAALFGGLLALVLLQMRSMPLPVRLLALPMFDRINSLDLGVPYGLPMALAALVVFPETPWFELLS